MRDFLLEEGVPQGGDAKVPLESAESIESYEAVSNAMVASLEEIIRQHLSDWNRHPHATIAIRKA
jgi:hypothetical protein